VIVALLVHQHRKLEERGHDDAHPVEQFELRLGFIYEPIDMRRMQDECSGLAAVLADELLDAVRD